ncbi:MAG: hypothetical protein AAFR82_07515, partial [Pseudomonadota bacterium]
MPRRLIALLIALYAIAFAFGAMAAIRWPSLMMLAGFFLEEEAMAGLTGIDWRQLGIAYGAPYFLAALCFYAAALSLGNRQKAARLWYLMGAIAGFPCIFLVDFEAGWWRDPSAGEGAVAGAAAGAILLGVAVWDLCRSSKPKKAPTPEAEPAIPVIVSPETAIETKREPQRRYRKPIPAAIARQRAHFTAEGRKMRA